MSTENTSATLPNAPVNAPLSMHDLAAVLIKHYGIHEGKYDLWLEFQVGTGAVGPDPNALTPGALIGVSKVGLILSRSDGATTVDAAAINPAKKARKNL